MRVNTTGLAEFSWCAGTRPKKLEGVRLTAAGAYALTGLFLRPKTDSIFTDNGTQSRVMDLSTVDMVV